jgi:hypothetical protein
VKEGNVIFGDYAVGVIDVLNQRDKLRQWERPKDQAGTNALINVLKQTWGPVSQFRESVRNVIADFEKRTERPTLPEYQVLYDQLTSDQKAQLAKLRRVEFGTMFYSDTITVHSRLFNEHNVPQLSGFYLFLSALGGLMLASLASGIAIRGAIEVGLAGPLPQGDIYGPVVVGVHDLEAKIAQYPRLVVGKQAIEFLDFVERKASGHPFDQIAKGVASDCRKLICADPVDGWPIVDYLGAGFKDLIEGGYPAKVIASAINFAETQYKNFAASNDIKLAPRYDRLRSYLKANQQIWLSR